MSPIMNGSRNPNVNGTINPRINGSINPDINGSINPKINGSINPNINQNFLGKYVFDLTLREKEFIIHANDKIIIFFNMMLNMTRFGVLHSHNGYVVFDLNNTWISHLEFDSNNGYNEFDLSNNWVNIIK